MNFFANYLKSVSLILFAFLALTTTVIAQNATINIQPKDYQITNEQPILSNSLKSAPIYGPLFPPPLGLTFSQSGLQDDGTIGRTGGKYWYFSSVTLASITDVYWGAINDSILISFDGSTFTEPPTTTYNEFLAFRPDLSDTANGILIWQGETRMPTGASPVYTRLRVDITKQDSITTLAVTDAQALGLAADVGAVLSVYDTSVYQARLRAQASFDSTSGYIPSLDFYDVNTTAGNTAYTSVSFGFYWDNSPPNLNTNNGLTVSEGGSGIITNSLLLASDIESNDSELIFTVAPDTSGSPPQKGEVKLNNVPLGVLDTFTQEDIDSGRVTYEHDGSETTSDGFQFNITDGDGAVASDMGFTVFTFSFTINPVNDKPVATDSSYETNIGGSVADTLHGTDAEASPLTYAIITNGMFGDAVVTDSVTGEFSYTTLSDTTGIDSFEFSVSDGALSDTGTITIDIHNFPPSAVSDSAQTTESVPIDDTLSATDPDPGQALIYLILVDGTRGHAVVTDQFAGEFTYTPDPGQFGLDSFTFVANDGFINSPQTQFYVSISPTVGLGDMVITTLDSSVVVYNSSVNSQARFATHDMLIDPRGITVATSGNNAVNIFVMDGSNGVVSIDPTTAVQAVVSPSSNFTGPPIGPIGIAMEANGDIVVADAGAGILRVDSSSGIVTVLSSGGSFLAPIGLTVAGNGDIYVVDVGLLFGDTSRVIRVNPSNGAQTVVSKGDNLAVPIGITIESDGNLLVCDGAQTGGGGGAADLIIRIDPNTGVQSVMSSNDLLNLPYDLTAGINGDVYVVNRVSQEILQVDPVSGAQSILTSGQFLHDPRAMFLFESCCTGNRGDCNNDGIDANLLDLNFLVNRVFRGGPPPVCPEEGDCNSDGSSANLLDLNYLVNKVFRGGPAPGPC